MTIHEKTWTSAVCECSISYLVDVDVLGYEHPIPDDSLPRIIRKTCSSHAKLTTPETLSRVVVLENQNWATAIRKVEEAIPTAFIDVVREGGSVSKQLKSGVEINSEFDENRKLTITTKGLTVKEQSSVDLVKTSLLIDVI